MKTAFAVPRRTEIVDWAGDMEDEDLIEREDMVVTITSGGYIKRTPLAEFRSQNRGGKGLSSMATKEDDVVTTLFVANTHTNLLFFTTDGMVYKLKTWRLPLAGRTAKGKAMVNILPIQQGISIAALMPVDAPEAEWDDLQIVFATSDGDVRQNDLSDFANVKRNGKIAMNLPEGVTLVNAAIADENDDIMLVTALGPGDPLLDHRDPRVQIARLDRRARHPALARATRWCRCRSSATLRPSRTSAPPISSSAA